jgi:hypothetical protein
MPTKAEKLLEQMRVSKKNWKRRDLETLYEGFGFIIESSRGPHDKVVHPDYPMLITSLPRHRELAVYLVDEAIRMIEKLKILEQGKKGEQ